MNTFLRYIILLIIIASISACNVSRNINEGQYIVAGNHIKISGDENISKVELEPYIAQPQTPATLKYFYANLWVYKTFKAKKDNGFNRWIIRIFGDEPVIWDPALTYKSEKDIRAYLNNIGYFNAEVYSSIFQNKSKATITYKINPKKPYRLDSLSWNISDSNLVNEDLKKNSLLSKGDIFNTYTLDDERNRISDFLRNQGYYDFNKEFISFVVDSSLNKHAINIITMINGNDAEQDFVSKGFKKYSISKIFIYPNFELDNSTAGAYDTLIIDLGSIKNARATGKYSFLYKDKLKIRPSVVAQSVFIEPDEYFHNRDLKETYRKLNRFPIYKYTDISFHKKEDTIHPSLDTHIKLHRSRLQYYSIETDGTNSNGDLGVRLGFNYGNKNLFRGGELINLRISTAFENRKYSDYESENRLFNTLEYGIALSLYSPTFIVPLKQSRFPKYFTPRTVIRFGYNYQMRPSYERHISSFQFGYEWKQSKTVFHRFSILDMSVTKIFPSPNFQASLDTITNERYKDQYQDHFIASIKYNYTYNTQQQNKRGSFTFFNARVEAAGNLTYSIMELLNASKSNGYYTVSGIRFAQFLRLELDYRHYIALTNNQGVIYRFNTGLGLPYGNSLAMPFEKGFYGGGANGMRAWAYRDLGPGNYQNAIGSEYDKMGDVKLEANLEYRFPLFGYLKGATFIDMGNIWLLQDSETFPGGKFYWNTFYKQFALDAGIGFRLDFNFFLVRLDGALKVQDPSKEEMFVLPKSQIKDVYWSFGIGYPF